MSSKIEAQQKNKTAYSVTTSKAPKINSEVKLMS